MGRVGRANMARAIPPSLRCLQRHWLQTNQIPPETAMKCKMNHEDLALHTAAANCPKCDKLLRRGPREITEILPPCPRCGRCGFIEDADMNLAGECPECKGTGRALIRHNDKDHSPIGAVGASNTEPNSAAPIG